MNYEIRSISKSEISSLVILNDAAVPAVNRLSPGDFSKLLIQAKYSLIVSLAHNLIGFLIALPPKMFYQSSNYQWFDSNFHSFLYIDRIVIERSYQRKGLGHILYKRLIDLNAKEYPRLCCEVNIKPKNEKSLNFHKGYGFRKVGTQKTENGAKQVILLEYKLH